MNQTTYFLISFNTQPPEGGWQTTRRPIRSLCRFQHTAARRRLALGIRIPATLRPFQHTAARRRLGSTSNRLFSTCWFQHTAARRRLVDFCFSPSGGIRVSTHSRPKAAGVLQGDIYKTVFVSTHSRPKAAGLRAVDVLLQCHGFNTQPPEGGWVKFNY